MERDGDRARITLAAPRPGTARRQNEYIETPLRLPEPPRKVAPITAQPQKEQHSIICRQCGQCRCEACTGPRHLPAKWVCDNKCLCSPDNMLDYCSCLCCVRGLFYHWAKDYEMDMDVSCADQPCSCAPPQRLLRWGCLGLLALPLPCLCCYWPLKGCLKACEGCYSGCSSQGCKCQPQRTQKSLLDPDC